VAASFGDPENFMAAVPHGGGHGAAHLAGVQDANALRAHEKRGQASNLPD